MDIKQIKLLQAIDECNKHIKRMLYAHKKMERFIPIDGSQYDNLTDEQIETIDQFIFRFSKLQDAMGERLFRNILIFLEEEVKNKPFIDLLNRNDFSHEYVNESETNALNINLAHEQTKILYDIFIHIKTYITDNTSLLTEPFTENYILDTTPYNN